MLYTNSIMDFRGAVWDSTDRIRLALDRNAVMKLLVLQKGANLAEELMGSSKWIFLF